MKHKLLLLAAAGVATAVISSRRRQSRLVAPLVPDEWRTDPDDYFDNDPINTRNAGASLDEDDEGDVTREALGLVRAIDEQEIEAAEQALARPDLDPALAAFADMLLADHSESLAAAQALQIEPITTAEVADLGQRRSARLDTMDELDGEEYADAFLQAQVDSHQEALAMLDRLLPEAVDEDVRSYLANSRNHIAHHLQRGRELLAQR
jgi:putative membrane protein